MVSEKPKEERTWTEEIEVLGHELVDKVKKLVAEGNVRRLIVRTPEGQVLIELPLTTGVAVGGVVTLMAPVLAALGALAALLAHAKVEIVRTGPPGQVPLHQIRNRSRKDPVFPLVGQPWAGPGAQIHIIDGRRPGVWNRCRRLDWSVLIQTFTVSWSMPARSLL